MAEINLEKTKVIVLPQAADNEQIADLMCSNEPRFVTQSKSEYTF